MGESSDDSDEDDIDRLERKRLRRNGDGAPDDDDGSGGGSRSASPGADAGAGASEGGLAMAARGSSNTARDASREDLAGAAHIMDFKSTARAFDDGAARAAAAVDANEGDADAAVDGDEEGHARAAEDRGGDLDDEDGEMDDGDRGDDWVRAGGPSSKVFLRRGTGPRLDYDNSKVSRSSTFQCEAVVNIRHLITFLLRMHTRSPRRSGLSLVYLAAAATWRISRLGGFYSVTWRIFKVQFWTSYSYRYKEILLKDKFDHSTLASSGAVMMIASSGAAVIAIVSTATGHIVCVTPAIGVYTFSGDVRGDEHRELCSKAAGHVKASGVLADLPERAFTVKLAPMTLHEAVSRVPRRARGPKNGGSASTPEAPEADPAAAFDAAAAAAEAAAAAAARRGAGRKPPPKCGKREGPDDDSGKGGKRATQPLAKGDFVRRDDGTVPKITSASTKAGWSRTHSGRKAKRGEGAILMEQAAGLEAYEERLKQMTSAAELASMSDQLKKMQNAIDEAIAARVAAEESARRAQEEAQAARLEDQRKLAEFEKRAAAAAAELEKRAAERAAEVVAKTAADVAAVAEEARRAAAAPAPAPAPAPVPAPAAHVFDLAGPPPGSAAAAAAAAAELGGPCTRHTELSTLAQLMAERRSQTAQQPTMAGGGAGCFRSF